MCLVEKQQRKMHLTQNTFSIFNIKVASQFNI